MVKAVALAAAVRTKERLSFQPGDFRLVTPGGTTIPLATELYFESPDAHWSEGSYQLLIDNGRARAALPIELK